MENRWLKTKARLARWKRVLISTWPSRMIIAIVLVILVYFLSQRISIVLDRPDTPLTLHFMNLIAIIGMIATITALVFTFLQLQIANDRIRSYHEFFKYSEYIFNEIKRGEAHNLYFYCSTVLPGNVSHYKNHKGIDKFQERLKSLVERAGSFSKLDRIAILVPSLQAYDETYSFFTTHKLPDCVTESEWMSFYKSKKEEAREFQEKLQARSDDLITVEASNLDDIKHAYFISNGYRIIYAKPLHYETPSSYNLEIQNYTPYLFGYTTTDTAIVRAFDQAFEQLLLRYKIDFLYLMYELHLVSRRFVENELRTKGKTIDSDDLTIEDLKNLDHDHFDGEQATDNCINAIGIDNQSVVLDIGSGLGGPARYIANNKPGCRVTGIELLPDRHNLSEHLTKKLKLDDKVTFLLGDISNREYYERSFYKKFTHIISFLSILHINSKDKLLKHLGGMLNMAGRVYIEDYVQGDHYGEALKQDLLKSVACTSLLTETEYCKLLERGGLRIDSVDDLTNNWANNASLRLSGYRNEYTQLENTHGKEMIDNAIKFADSVDKLFSMGAIRGLRIVCTKTWERLRKDIQ